MTPRKRQHDKNTKLPQRVYWVRNQWQYRAREGERDLLSKTWWPLGGTKEDLVPMLHAYADLQERLGQAGGMDLLFSRFERDVLSDRKQYSDRTIADKRTHIAKLRKVFGHMDPTAIRPTHCAQYLDIRGKQSRSQANQEFNTLSVVFKWGVRWGVIDRNPCTGLSRHKIAARERLPSWDELQAFMSVCSPLIRYWVLIKYKTGLRQTDIRQLKVKDIDFTRKLIDVKTSKTGKRLEIPLDSELEAIVRGVMAENRVQGETLFCTSRGRQWSKSTFDSRWQYCMNKALETGVLKERFWEHDIRAAFATVGEEEYGLDATGQLGHDNPKQKEAYLRNRKAQKITVLPIKK